MDEWINRLLVLCNILGDIYRLSTELYLDLVFEFELGPGSRGQARPGQAAAPGTLYNDVESPSSELVLLLICVDCIYPPRYRPGSGSGHCPGQGAAPQ